MIEFHGMRFSPSAAADRLMAVRWQATELGCPSLWPASFKIAVQTCLNSRYPMTIIWGGERIVLYNDGYIPIMGTKHPLGFGRPVGEVYPELAEFLQPALDDILSSGSSLHEQDLQLPLCRGGEVVEAYFTFCYSPLQDEQGNIRGVLSVAEETTAGVLHQRRSKWLGRLTQDLAKHRAPDLVAPVIQRALEANATDFEHFAGFMLQSNGQCKVLWQSSPEFVSHLQHAVSLAWPAAAGGRYAGVTELSHRCFALTLVDPEVLQGGFRLVVRPGRAVKVGTGYLETLHMLGEILLGAAYRIAGERQALSDMTRQLDERDRLYRLLFEHSHEGILLCEPDGSVTAANPAACAMLGYSETQIRRLGRSGVVSDSGGDLDDALAQRREAGRFVGTLTFIRSDGSEMVADVSSVLVTDPASGEERVVTLFRDAAHRLMTQQRIATTARLEGIGALTGGIAHDFNNLLNVIINGAESLVDRLPESDVGRQHADLVLSASLRAADLTRQLLAFSRQQTLEVRTVELGESLRKFDQILSRAIGAQVEVDLQVNERLFVEVDESLLQSAILNLCINARDAMPKGGRLSICAAPLWLSRSAAAGLELQPGNYACIRVIDSGAGIAPGDLDKIFEPFFTTKPEGKGTGLGLSMVFGFMRQSFGGMRVVSTPGQGTEVQLFLPLREPAVVSKPETSAARENETFYGAGRRILVVEDDDLLGSMLSQILDSAGYAVTLVADASAALAQLDEGVDLVITDILLGAGMDGWTLAQRIGERRPDLPVVTMSGYAPADPHTGQYVPRPLSLRKPFRPKEILAVLQAQLAAP